MNNKENNLRKIVDIVVSCCATDIGDGEMSVTAEEVLSKCRKENVVMTRQIATIQIIHAGYTVTTVSQLFKCTPNNVRKLISDGYENIKLSRAFNLAYSEATMLCKDITGM